MNILLLSQFFSTTRGGGEYLFAMIAKLLAENGHKVWVISHKIFDEKYQSHENINLIFVKPELKHKGVLPAKFSENRDYILNAIKEGKKLIKNEKIDIIHSNNFSPAIAGSVLAYFTSKPHITSIWDIFSLCGQDYWHKWNEQFGGAKINEFLGSKFERLILKLRHSAIHTISEATKEDLKQIGAKDPIYMISPCVEENKSEYVSVDKNQFIYVGRLVFYKNLEVAIKAIAIVKNTKKKIKLVIVGDGPIKRKLESLVEKLEVKENVEFKGYTTTEAKNRLISQSNAMIFPSLCEGFGLVILEAFNLSKPVIVSDVRPMSDIVLHEKTGFVLDTKDENIWAKYILELACDFDLSSKMGKQCKQVLENEYNQSKMLNDVLRMYNDNLS